MKLRAVVEFDASVVSFITVISVPLTDSINFCDKELFQFFQNFSFAVVGKVMISNSSFERVQASVRGD